MSDVSSDAQDVLPDTKAGIRAVIDAVDQWIEDNSTSFNQALPQPFRGLASPRLKAMVFMAVAAKKFRVI